MNREQFEKLEHIKNRLAQGGVYWDGNKYSTLPFMNSFVSTAIFLNGAWYAYQEQQKKIDVVKDEINNFFDNQTTTPSPREYANKIADMLELLK